jgi:hypothetical protein
VTGSCDRWRGLRGGRTADRLPLCDETAGRRLVSGDTLAGLLQRADADLDRAERDERGSRPTTGTDGAQLLELLAGRAV